MRCTKTLLNIFLCVYFIAGLSLLVTGSVAHRQANQYANITGHSLTSAAGFIIALGVLILLLSIFGFYSSWKNHQGLLKFFIASLILILVLELIATIVGFALRRKADQQLKKTLLDSMNSYKDNAEIAQQWDHLQQRWSCCGVLNATDWFSDNTTATIPKSCYLNPPNQSISTNQSSVYSRGCYDGARTLFLRYSKALGGVSLFFFFVELFGLGLAILVLRDLQKNYRTV